MPFVAGVPLPDARTFQGTAETARALIGLIQRGCAAQGFEVPHRLIAMALGESVHTVRRWLEDDRRVGSPGLGKARAMRYVHEYALERLAMAPEATVALMRMLDEASGQRRRGAPKKGAPKRPRVTQPTMARPKLAGADDTAA